MLVQKLLGIILIINKGDYAITLNIEPVDRPEDKTMGVDIGIRQ